MSAILRSLKSFYEVFGIASLQQTGRNAYLIILARSLRMFAYGANNLILAIFFSALGYSDHLIGVFMTLTLLGDVFLATFLTLVADRVGRRRVLLGGSLLMVISGVVFAIFENFWILLAAAISGVISVTGGDFGPFRSIEESMISEITTFSTRSDVLAWYVTSSALGNSIGSEASGRIIHNLQNRGWTEVDAYHAIFWIFAVAGCVNTALVLCLGSECELQSDAAYSQLPTTENSRVDRHGSPPRTPIRSGPISLPGRARSWFSRNFAQISKPTLSVVSKLWFLLAVDSLADGMVPYSLTNYYMDIKFHPAKSTLGDVMSVSYFLAAVGSAFAGPLARKLGLINTMVFTHVPSSAAVLVFSLPSAFWMTVALFLVRTGLNNMDQAPRAAFIAAVVQPEERTAVMGITSMLRTMSSMGGPTVTGILAANEQFWIAFVVAGICRLSYDFGLYALFVNMKINPDEEKESAPPVHTVGDDEDFELESLTSDDSGYKVEVDGANGSTAAHANSLNVPVSSRTRSRSPHRPEIID